MNKDHEDDCPYNYGHNCCCLSNPTKSAQSNKADTNDKLKQDISLKLYRLRYTELNDFSQEFVDDVTNLIAQETNKARRSERAWAYKNMRDHGTDPQWVEIAKLRYERLTADKEQADG